MRPVVKAGLRRLWRPGGALQVGVTPGRSLLLNGLDPASARFVAALDGTRDVPGVLTFAEQLGLSGAHATKLLDMLARAGFLDDAGYDTAPALRGMEPAEAERMAPDLAALALGYLIPGGAVRAVARRRQAVVAVYGCGRVGASVAHLLAAAGVGCVVPVDAGRARPADAAPAGFRNPRIGEGRDVPGPRRRGSGWGVGRGSDAEAAAEAAAVEEAAEAAAAAAAALAKNDGDGAEVVAAAAHDGAASREARVEVRARAVPRRQDLVRALIRSSAPATRTSLPSNRQYPDVAVLAPVGDAYPAQAATLQAALVPHLSAEVHETTGVLGPFVQPGRTSCLRCRDMFRTARDPGWPRAMVPFGGLDAVPAGTDRACDVMMATQVALHAAQQVLAFIEGDPLPTVNATLELAPPFGRQSRHERPPHPDCGCGALESMVEEGSVVPPARVRPSQ